MTTTTAAPPTAPVFDEARAGAFMGTAMTHLSGALTTYACAIGDKLGLFKDLAAAGPATSAEFADRTGISERYAREWLSMLTCAGYFDHDPASDRFTLPIEHQAPLASEGDPMFLGAFYQFPLTLERSGILGRLTEAFVSGRGVAQEAYGPEYQVLMERLSAPWFDVLLLGPWLEAMPDLVAKLEAGANVADIGSGAGRALIRLAERFPKSRFVGYNIYPPAIALARTKAEAAGVGDCVRFEQRDAASGLDGSFDIITAFDVLHDSAQPLDLVTAVRKALAPGGTFVAVEINAGETLAANAGPMGAIFFGISIMYCMSTSIAQGGAALGTAGLPESKLRELGVAAGLASVKRVVESPFNVVYRLER